MMTLMTLMTLLCSRSEMPSLASLPSYRQHASIATLYRHLSKRNNIRVSPRVLPLWAAGGLSIGVASIGYVSPAGDSARDNSRGTATCGNTGRGSAPATPISYYKRIMYENNCLRKGNIIWQTDRGISGSTSE